MTEQFQLSTELFRLQVTLTTTEAGHSVLSELPTPVLRGAVDAELRLALDRLSQALGGPHDAYHR